MHVDRTSLTFSMEPRSASLGEVLFFDDLLIRTRSLISNQGTPPSKREQQQVQFFLDGSFGRAAEEQVGIAPTIFSSS